MCTSMMILLSVGKITHTSFRKSMPRVLLHWTASILHVHDDKPMLVVANTTHDTTNLGHNSLSQPTTAIVS